MRPVLGPATGDALHVVTYNLRYPADDPDHRWRDRRPAMAALLKLEQPTIIGTQEGFYRQLRELTTDLGSDFGWVGVGREGGSRGEFSAVCYDATRLDPIEYLDLWLSDTPALIGSATWGNTIPRMATWVRFADRVSGGEFVVLNTHLDNHSENARRRSADLLAATLESFTGIPTIVTGDFNTPAETSPTYARLVTGAGLHDTWRTAERRVTPAFATYGGYRRPVSGERIDWVLVTPGVVVEAAAINPTAVDGRFPSDHLPVQAHLRLP
jgi:endonuclease/exonuclease/phosphatase family metal-dependent hydrolase